MAPFSFRIRNPQRDLDTDRDRFDRLLEHVHRLQAEIEGERNGLQARYRQAQDSAAFAFEAFENGGGAVLSSRADDLALTMRRYEARLAELGRQADFVRSMRAQIEAFRDAPASVASDP